MIINRLNSTEANKPRKRFRNRTGPSNSNNSNNNNNTTKLLEKVPSLKDFMHKQSVVSQYRSFLRTLQTIDDDVWKNQLKKDVQKEFQKNIQQKDPMAVKMAFNEGKRQLAQLQSIVGTTGSSKSSNKTRNTTSTTNINNNDINYNVNSEEHQKIRDASELDPDSWINTPDKEDQRGRVGSGWPWQTK